MYVFIITGPLKVSISFLAKIQQRLCTERHLQCHTLGHVQCEKKTPDNTCGFYEQLKSTQKVNKTGQSFCVIDYKQIQEKLGLSFYIFSKSKDWKNNRFLNSGVKCITNHDKWLKKFINTIWIWEHTWINNERYGLFCSF